MAQQVIDVLRRLALGAVAAQHNLAGCIGIVRAIVMLARYLTARPAGLVQLRVDQLCSGVGLILNRQD
jgi:hypothetical protein